MLTLHKATEETKTAIKWGIIGILGIMVFFMIIGMIKSYIKSRTPPPPPTVSFGVLPAIEFPTNATKNALSYSLDTVTGTFSAFPDRATVFQITAQEPNLLDLTRAKEKVTKTGFVNRPAALSQTLYQWNNTTPPFKQLTLDILSFNFSLTSDYIYDQTILSASNLPNEQTAITKAQAFLTNMSAFPTDIDLDKTTTQLFTLVNGKMLPATSFSNAKFIRVDFFQKNINDLPIYYPQPPNATMHFLVAGGNFDGQVVEGNFYHHTVLDASATYPIKSALEAFEELKNGEGYIASYFGTDTTISLKDVFLGYYMSNKLQSYLMPIVIFQGNNGFFAYVSAIKGLWITK